MWLNFFQTKLLLPLITAAVLLGMVFTSPGGAALTLANAGHDALEDASPGSDTGSAGASIEPYVARVPSHTTILSDQPDPSVAGQPFIVAFRVIGGFFMPLPTGTVTVTASPGDIRCTGILASGSGSCSLTLSEPRAYTLTARYSGNSRYLPSSDTEPHSVVLKSTTNITSDLPDPSQPGTPFSVAFSVTSTTGQPTGTVTVTASPGGASCTGALASDGGSCSLAIAHPGVYILTAAYPGNASYAPSSDSEAHAVKAETTTAVFDLPDPSLPGQPFTATFSVTSTWGTPAGEVTVTALPGEADCTGELVSGSGSCTLAIAAAGYYFLTAAYAGDESHLAGAATALHTVAQAETTTTLEDLPDLSLPGQPFTAAFSVASAWDTPTGAVTVIVLGGGASCTGALTDGRGSCSLALALPGEYTLEAAYPGDANHLGSLAAGAHTVLAIHIYLPVTVR